MVKLFESIKEGLLEALDYAKGEPRIGTRHRIEGKWWRWDGTEWIEEKSYGKTI
jgi:hypothetical protein